MTKPIPADVLAALQRARCQGNTLHLTEQLDPRLYQQVKKFLELLGITWNRSRKCHVCDVDCAERIDEAVLTGQVTDFKKLYQFFPTPDELADRLIAKAQVQPDHDVLEPSAGRGSLVRALQRAVPGIVPTCCELDPANYPYLNQLPICLALEPDFLRADWPTCFHRIIANPPFRSGQDIAHVRRMYDLLRPGGRLVAITSPSWTYRENGEFAKFRNWLTDLEHEVEQVPEGAFAASGTAIRTLMLTITKSERAPTSPPPKAPLPPSPSALRDTWRPVPAVAPLPERVRTTRAARSASPWSAL